MLTNIHIVSSFGSCFVLFYYITLVFADGFSYRAQNEWEPKKICLNGERQSPIDIETKLVIVNDSLKIERKNYNLPFSNFIVINDGHTAKLQLSQTNPEERPYITGTALDNQKYIFEQLHFHWSGERGRGSEHAINGKLRSMEMHFVHYNEKYGDFTKALNNSLEDGLAVIGVLFDITVKDNRYFNSLLDGVNSVKIANIENKYDSKQNTVTLDNLLPNNLDLFYRYKGSLTTPPCHQIVNWLVFSDINGIGLKQIKIFRDLLDSKKSLLSDTFRELQSIKDRKIYASQTPDEVKGQASQIQLNLFIMQFSLATSLVIIAKKFV